MKLIILDRDGVINQDSDAYVKSAAEWKPIPGSIDAIVRLFRSGYKIVIATNQSGIGRGLFSYNALDAMHAKLKRLLFQSNVTLNGIFFCPHIPEDNCNCRKPASGLLDDIATQLKINLTGVPIVGDSLRDLQAGLTHRCTPILVRTGKGVFTEMRLKEQNNIILKNAKVFDNLSGVADYFCNIKK
ncbi:MAG: D-glycero-beta-D-manno-heptose-1,7-bisphosphate 7-phosphatase [Porticoccus sp.]|nr:D-glycero-beta-D-manno-heptose-1,7-bisphosphate 7-phosphatase [Porticoccus sp.]